MDFVGINLNHELLVQIDLEGFKHWKKYEDEKLRRIKAFLPLYEGQEKPLEHYICRQNKDGWVPIQGFEFMAVFGSHVRMGFNMFKAGLRITTEHTELINQ